MGMKLRRGVVRAAAAGAAVLSATLIVGAGVASAAPPADPPGGAVPVPPHFYNGNVEGIRDSGSDTTFFMMQKIGDLYTAGGLYGCSIDSAAGQPLYNTSDAASLTTVATTSADLVGGTPTSTIAVNTTTVAIPNGSILFVEGTPNQQVTVTAAAPIGSTSISVNSFTPSVTYASGATVGEPESTTANVNSFCQAGQNADTTDINDNWDRTEVTQGVDAVGSSAGQNQLCGAAKTPLPVDFARSSKPSSGACSNMVQTGYAKDGVPIIDYPVNPSTFGSTSPSGIYSSINGGNVGTITKGWLPGDPVACTSNTSGCSGTRLTNISNNDNGASPTSATSTAYRIWCSSTAAPGQTSQITDWGALTNLGGTTGGLEAQGVVLNSSAGTATVPVDPSTGALPSTILTGQTITGPDIPASDTIQSIAGNVLTLTTPPNNNNTDTVRIITAAKLAVGQGMPVGIQVRPMGVNTSSGTESTFASFANQALGASGGCTANMDTRSPSDPNPATKVGDNASAHTALENNSDQLDQFASADFPNPDFTDQAIEIAETLYIESNGVYNTSPFSAAATVNGTSFTGVELNENGIAVSASADLANSYPTARTLFNIYVSTTIRASTGGFLNYICDPNTNFLKNGDNSTGVNFDTELGNIISTQFGFPRLTDQTQAVATATPADGLSAPNDSCQATLSVVTTAGQSTITLPGGTANFPVDIPNQGGLADNSATPYPTNQLGTPEASDPADTVVVASANTPAADYVVSGSGTNTLTLAQPATQSGTVSMTFGGVPSVQAVNFPQS